MAAVFSIALGVWTFGLAKTHGTSFIFLGTGCVAVLFAVILQAKRFHGRTKDTNWL